MRVRGRRSAQGPLSDGMRQISYRVTLLNIRRQSQLPTVFNFTIQVRQNERGIPR
jgi:hypothetical protein